MNKLNVLIVDDIKSNRLIIRFMLNDDKFLFHEAHNGRVAIEILENQNIDFVFMDIDMPEMNGIEAIQHIRSKMPYPLNNIPVIAVTAKKYDYNGIEINYLRAGFTDLIIKPVSLEKIINISNRYLNKTLI